jgi:hypothetical protein
MPGDDGDALGRRVPHRTCVGCHLQAPATEMQRISARPDGRLGTGRAAPGRGAWVCGAGCFDEAVRRGAFERALRRRVSKADLVGVRAKLFNIS